ncbi:MAG TPA: hypothetical protein PLM75_09885 [bacterium]|nr:hypothetical protein [bacterium]HPP88156.1 hypothetical protein [bacterium]
MKLSKDAQKWQRGNLKLEGDNWLLVKLKMFYVLTFKSRHCTVYHRVWRYTVSLLGFLIIIGMLFGIHYLLFGE